MCGETWLRPGELCIIKATLMYTPALNICNDEDIVIYAKSGMTTEIPAMLADRTVVSLWHVNRERTCNTRNWIVGHSKKVSHFDLNCSRIISFLFLRHT